jgi:hypothetical protein
LLFSFERYLYMSFYRRPPAFGGEVRVLFVWISLHIHYYIRSASFTHILHCSFVSV